MFQNKKLALAFNKLNKKRSYKTLSFLKFKNNKFYHTEPNKNDNYTIEAKPIISRTYYKDPFFLNESNLGRRISFKIPPEPKNASIKYHSPLTYTAFQL